MAAAAPGRGQLPGTERHGGRRRTSAEHLDLPAERRPAAGRVPRRHHRQPAAAAAGRVPGRGCGPRCARATRCCSAPTWSRTPRCCVAAYDDAAGVTAAFNRNVLHVLQPRSWTRTSTPTRFDHVALWDPEQEWIEMRLRPAQQRRCGAALGPDRRVRGRARSCAPRCRRSSAASRASAELAAAGFALRHWWTDPAGSSRCRYPSPPDGTPRGTSGPRPVQAQLPDQFADHPASVDGAAAEQVDRDQLLFRPGVDAQVRLGQDEDQRDRAVRERDVIGAQHVAVPGAHRVTGHRGHPGQVGDGGRRGGGRIDRVQHLACRARRPAGRTGPLPPARSVLRCPA